MIRIKYVVRSREEIITRLGQIFGILPVHTHDDRNCAAPVSKLYHLLQNPRDEGIQIMLFSKCDS